MQSAFLRLLLIWKRALSMGELTRRTEHYGMELNVPYSLLNETPPCQIHESQTHLESLLGYNRFPCFPCHCSGNIDTGNGFSHEHTL